MCISPFRFTRPVIHTYKYRLHDRLTIFFTFTLHLYNIYNIYFTHVIINYVILKLAGVKCHKLIQNQFYTCVYI